MTTSPRGDCRFAFFASDANFSRQVLRYLLANEIVPQLIVVPEYPPAALSPGHMSFVNAAKAGNALLDLMPGVDVEFLPQSKQLETVPKLASRKIDFGLIACWPYLMKTELIQAPTRAMLNLHPSLLPRYRGADPVGAQLEQGESTGGVSLHLLNERFDAGDIVAQAGFDISPDERERCWIETKCALLGVRLFADAVATHALGWRPQPQSAL